MSTQKQPLTAEQQAHIRAMKQKYTNMMLSGRSMLADMGLKPVFGAQPSPLNTISGAQPTAKKENKNDK